MLAWILFEMYDMLISEANTKEGKLHMADYHIFMCTNDLNKLRKSYGWTIDALSERTHISPRTLNRIEYANGTRNESMARKLAEAFEKPFEDFFTRVSEHILQRLKSTVPPLSERNLIPDLTYYALYVRRVSDMDANIWGKTKWIQQYDETHELRILHELSSAGAFHLFSAGLPVINTEKDWTRYIFHRQIGRTQKVILSEEAAKSWMLSYILEAYVIEPSALMETGIPDVVLLGDYTNRTSVRSLRAVKLDTAKKS